MPDKRTLRSLRRWFLNSIPQSKLAIFRIMWTQNLGEMKKQANNILMLHKVRKKVDKKLHQPFLKKNLSNIRL